MERQTHGAGRDSAGLSHNDSRRVTTHKIRGTRISTIYTMAAVLPLPFASSLLNVSHTIDTNSVTLPSTSRPVHILCRHHAASSYWYWLSCRHTTKSKNQLRSSHFQRRAARPDDCSCLLDGGPRQGFIEGLFSLAAQAPRLHRSRYNNRQDGTLTARPARLLPDPCPRASSSRSTPTRPSTTPPSIIRTSPWSWRGCWPTSSGSTASRRRRSRRTGSTCRTRCRLTPPLRRATRGTRWRHSARRSGTSSYPSS